MIERMMNPTITLTRKHFATEEDWQRAIREGGTFTLAGGIRVHLTLGEEMDLDDDGGVNLGEPVAKVSISGSHDVEVTTYTEEVTFHPDGSYSRRLG